MSKPRRQTQALLDELVECRWITMQALADEAEEAGDAAAARGWRWLAEHRKWPIRGFRYWYWQRAYTLRDDNVNDRLTHIIPYRVRPGSAEKTELPRSSLDVRKLLRLTALKLGALLIRLDSEEKA